MWKEKSRILTSLSTWVSCTLKQNTKLVKYNKFQNNDNNLFIFVSSSNPIATFRQRVTRKVNLAREQVAENITARAISTSTRANVCRAGRW